MRCPDCGRELSEGAEYCPSCEQKAGLSLEKPQEGGTAPTSPLDSPPSPARPQLESERSPRRGRVDVVPRSAQVASQWLPRRERVEAWAFRNELNHYEVLDLDENAPDEELYNRKEALRARLEQWANDPMDRGLQDLGAAGLRRFHEMEEAFRDRRRYNEELKRRRHNQAVEEVRRQAWSFVRDGVLQEDEYTTLKRTAEERGLSREELDGILKDLEHSGVLTGITVAGQRCRTLEELKEACRGRGDPLVEAIWNGELERWLVNGALVTKVREVKGRYEKKRQLGAQVWLWSAGETALVLNGRDGEERVRSLRQWIEGVYARGLENSSVQALEQGLLEEWLRIVMNREDLVRVAANERRNGRRGLWRLIWQTGERGLPESAYQASKRLVQEEPDFWEAHYQHAVHCRMTGRVREMQQHLKRAIQGNPTYAQRALVDPEFEEVREQVEELLQQLRLEKWREECLEPATQTDVLTPEDRARLLDEAERRGIDRTTAEEIIKRALPELDIQPSELDVGFLKRGAKAKQWLTVKNVAGGQLRGRIRPRAAWITVVPEALDPTKREQIVEVNIDTSTLKPKSQNSGIVIFETSGGVRSVPIRVSVTGGTSWALFSTIAALVVAAIVYVTDKPPVLERIEKEAQPNGQVLLTAYATDPDGNALRYEWKSSAGRIIPNPNGNTATLDTSGVGQASIHVTVRVSDWLRKSAERSLTIPKPRQPDVTSKGTSPKVKPPVGGTRREKLPPQPNKPPRIDGIDISPRRVLKGQPVRLSARASDDDGDQLRYQWFWEGQLIGTGDTITFDTSRVDTSRPVRIDLTVDDGRGGKASESVTIIVEPPLPNRPPRIDGIDISPRRVLKGQPVRLSARASDDDGDQLRYQWFWEGQLIGTGDTITFDTSRVDTSRPVRIDLTVDDGRGGRDSKRSDTIIVEPPPSRFLVIHFHNRRDLADSCIGYLEISGGRARYTATGGNERHDFPWAEIHGCGRSNYPIGNFRPFYVNLRSGQGYTFGRTDGYGNPLDPRDVLQPLGCN